MDVGLALIAAGFAQTFAGFIFFRQPGVRFWFFGPIWRASKYLNPTGVALWVGGSSISLVGVVILLAQVFSHHG